MLLRPDTMVDAAAILGSHLGGVDPTAIQLAFGTALRFRLDDRTLRDEFTQIVERYAKVFEGAAVAGTGATGAEALPSGSVTLEREYFNPVFVPGTTSFRSFRVSNSSGSTLATVGDRPFHISYWLEDANGVKTEGVRSRFPIPLLPGRDLTIPVRIDAPSVEGTYRITVMVVQEYVCWHETTPLFSGEIIVSSVEPAGPKLVVAPHRGFFDFEEDLARCGEMLAQAVEVVREETGVADLAILEVACGNDPQALRHYQPGTNVIACDLAFPQVQLGALAFARGGRVAPERYAFAAADVFNAPFQVGSFQIVVVCAALHHFTNIIKALQHLAALLAPGGKLVLMREPSKVAPEDPIYISELANGFNEQQFVLPEYKTMFDRAGLCVRYHRMDFECSYKVILERSTTVRPDEP